MYLFTRFLVAWIVFGIFFVIGVIVERNGKNIPYRPPQDDFVPVRPRAGTTSCF